MKGRRRRVRAGAASEKSAPRRRQRKSRTRPTAEWTCPKAPGVLLPAAVIGLDAGHDCRRSALGGEKEGAWTEKARKRARRRKFRTRKMRGVWRSGWPFWMRWWCNRVSFREWEAVWRELEAASGREERESGKRCRRRQGGGGERCRRPAAGAGALAIGQDDVPPSTRGPRESLCVQEHKSVASLRQAA